MKKVDRLGWTAGMAFTAYGTSVGIRTNDASFLDSLSGVLPPQWESVDAPTVETLFSVRIGPPSTRRGRKNYHLLYSGSTLTERSLDLDVIYQALEKHVHICVAYYAMSEQLFIHAGVVGWQNRAILLPGRSLAGKTTLTAQLLQAGATYYSDDMAILDVQGRVHPYPVSLSMREHGERAKYSPADFGGQIGLEPLPVGMLIFTQYEAGAVWRPRRLSPARAFTSLLSHTVAARRDPKAALPILRQVAAQASAFKTKRGEAVSVVDDLLRRASELRFSSRKMT